MKLSKQASLLKTNDIIVVEDDSGILHEMIVKSVDNNNRTVTGEVAFWKTSVRTITVPDHAIREVE